jgi:5-hydroxyisourate hydrolase
MIGITTHVLDTSRGRPAAGVSVTLERLSGAADWTVVGAGRTDDDGRLVALAGTVAAGTYRLVFDTAAYFHADGRRAFYPHVSIAFEVGESEAHCHVPLLLSPFGYTTYRGS